MKTFILSTIISLIFFACGINKKSFSPDRKFSLQQVQKDYAVYKTLLEEHHPGLYWYTSKDSMDYYFNQGQKRLQDSMTEPDFRKVLSYVTAKINCGHTTVRPSKKWNRYSNKVKPGKMFPLSMKAWDEAMVVTANLNRKDSILQRGTVITSINGKSSTFLTDTMFSYISTDGYNRTHKYQTLSNRGYFGSLYTSLFGLQEKYTVEYKDNKGQKKYTIIPVYNPAEDTAGRTGTRTFANPPPKPSKDEQKQQRLNNVRLLKIDSANHSAMMSLNSFGRGFGLKRFFRNSFKALKQNKTSHLIVDVRSNGGGSVTNSTILSRYMSSAPFKIADSLYAIKKGGHFSGCIKSHIWNNLFISLLTQKRKDGFYHFGYFERHFFKPKKNNHFDGKVYIVTGGNSFSATTLFTSALIKQDNVIVVGEETGGGAYGNSAWLIPDVTLPETHIRFRLPLFRLVINKNNPKDGKGIQPEVKALPSIDAIRRNADFKIEKVMDLIKNDKALNAAKIE